MRRRNEPAALLAGLALLGTLAGGAAYGAKAVVTDEPPARPSAAVSALRVAPAGTTTGYTREQFGPRWKDVDGNGCDTRNDILARDLVQERKRDRCVVVSGILADPYTGTTMEFDKADASAVQIDHVVPMAEAWRSGAATWTLDKRTAFANDPANLLAVNGRANSSKGARTPDQWMPVNKAAACRYVDRYIKVKVKYALTVTPVERDSLAHTSRECRRGSR